MHFALSCTKHSASPATMQAASSGLMDHERPVRTYRRARLTELLADVGGPKALFRLSGVTDTHLIAIVKGRRDVGDEMASMLENQSPPRRAFPRLYVVA